MTDAPATPPGSSDALSGLPPPLSADHQYVGGLPFAIGSAAEVREARANAIAAEKTDNQTEANCTEEERNIRVFRLDLRQMRQIGVRLKLAGGATRLVRRL